MPAGRPKAKIDPEQVEKLAGIGCTVEEIASVVGCHRDTIYAEFSDALTKGRNVGKFTLRNMQWRTANKGSATMQIWLGKQYLNQRDRLDLNSLTPEQAAAILAEDAGEDSQ